MVVKKLALGERRIKAVFDEKTQFLAIEYIEEILEYYIQETLRLKSTADFDRRFLQEIVHNMNELFKFWLNEGRFVEHKRNREVLFFKIPLTSKILFGGSQKAVDQHLYSVYSAFRYNRLQLSETSSLNEFRNTLNHLKRLLETMVEILQKDKSN